MKRLALAAAAACLAIAGCGGGHQTATHGGRVHSRQFVQQAERAHFPAIPGLLALPTVPGYDAVTVSAVPRSAQAVGCYASGRYVNCSSAHAWVPNAHLVTIATNAGAAAKVLDIEPGDAVPSQGPGWVRWMLSLHVYRPAIYANASTMGSVRYYLGRAGIVRSSYLLWVAAWDGNPGIPAGYDAKQWRSTSSLDYDTFGSWFFAVPAPPNAPGCDKPSAKESYCFGRFTSLTVRNARRGDWCSRGCNERRILKRWRGESGLARSNDNHRLAWLHGRLAWLTTQRTRAENQRDYDYGRLPNLAKRSRNIIRSSWNGYLA